MANKEEEFKVIDRRGSRGETKEEPPKPSSTGETAGEGFVMHESDKSLGPSEVDFSTLIFSLATGALIQMGLAPDPMTKEVHKNLELARQNIEILNMLKEKTRGNLTPEESALLENLLTETRLRFVEASRK